MRHRGRLALPSGVDSTRWMSDSWAEADYRYGSTVQSVGGHEPLFMDPLPVMRASFVVRLTLGLAALGLASGAASLHCSHLGGAPLLNAGAASGLLSADVALGSSPQHGGSCAWMLQMSANSAEEGRRIALFDLRVRTSATPRREAWFSSYKRGSVIKLHQIDSRPSNRLAPSQYEADAGFGKLSVYEGPEAHPDAILFRTSGGGTGGALFPSSAPLEAATLLIVFAAGALLFTLCLENISCLTLPLTPAARFCRRRG